MEVGPPLPLEPPPVTLGNPTQLLICLHVGVHREHPQPLWSMLGTLELMMISQQEGCVQHAHHAGPTELNEFGVLISQLMSPVRDCTVNGQELSVH